MALQVNFVLRTDLLRLMAALVLVNLVRLRGLSGKCQDFAPGDDRGMDDIVLPIHSDFVAASMGDILTFSHVDFDFDDFSQLFVFHRDIQALEPASTVIIRFFYRKGIEPVVFLLKFAV